MKNNIRGYVTYVDYKNRFFKILDVSNEEQYSYTGYMDTTTFINFKRSIIFNDYVTFDIDDDDNIVKVIFEEKENIFQVWIRYLKYIFFKIMRFK